MFVRLNLEWRVVEELSGSSQTHRDRDCNDVLVMTHVD